MADRARRVLSQLPPYTPGMTPNEASARFGVAAVDVVKLGSGENPFGPSPAAFRAISQTFGHLHQYPEWTALELREAIARHMGVESAQVVCGAGETELISCLIRAFADASDEVLMHCPTFPIYHLYAEAEGRRPVFSDAGPDPVMNVEDLISRLTEHTRLVFLTTPHNPSGRVVTLADIRRVCAASQQALVVVDEAYLHFSQQDSAVELLADIDNLIVLRTFSKAYGLAGLRVGFGIAGSEVVDALLRIKPTWNIGPLQVAGAVAALGDDDHISRTAETIRANRGWVTAELNQIPGLSVVPGSEANFVLLRLDESVVSSTDLHEKLASRGVIVKDCSASYLGLGDRHLRVDIGDEQAMGRLVEGLRDLLG
ncbi:MAG: histidinol-phosphate transaminase [bacterium]|nr:histidinol-phosphate transaminase [bacterium]